MEAAKSKKEVEAAVAADQAEAFAAEFAAELTALQVQAAKSKKEVEAVVAAEQAAAAVVEVARRRRRQLT